MLELSEAEFLAKYSIAQYINVVNAVRRDVESMPEFQNDLPYLHSLFVYKWKTSDGAKTLIIECDCKKVKCNGVSKMLMLSIGKRYISDEEMPDATLDRYNELMKIKKELENQNKQS